MTLVSPGIGSVAHFIVLVLAQSAAMLLGLPVYIFLKNRTLNLPRQWQQLIFAVFVVVWSGLNTLLWQQTRSRTILDIRLIAGFMNWVFLICSSRSASLRLVG
jgi:hypothetical protein